MIIKKFDLDVHDSKKVSELIYFTDAHTYDQILKNKYQAVNKIEKLVKAGNNSIGHEKICVVTNHGEEEVLGVLVIYKREESSFMGEIRTFLRVFPPLDAVRFTILDFLDSRLLVDIGPEDFYLACVAVDEKARGQGIGTFILESAVAMARKRDKKKAILNVDFENNGARRLYERFGFEINDQKTMRWFGGEKGMYKMEFLIK
jgi:ribosomal protein S18 acetylase RimI-like enzyme